MATSGSTNYSVNRDELITQALELIAVVEEGGTANSDQLDYGARTLNMMLKAWMPHGLQLWTIKRQSITPVLSKDTYTLGLSGADVTMDRPMKIVKAVYRETATTSDVPMIPLTRDEYWRLSDKTSTGTPVQYYFDPQTPLAKLSVWPTANTDFATNYTIEIIYQKPFDDMDNASDDFDFPSEWYEAIKYGLAVRMAPHFGVPLQERYLLRKEAQDILDLVMSWDTEQESVFFQPETSYGNS